MEKYVLRIQSTELSTDFVDKRILLIMAGSYVLNPKKHIVLHIAVDVPLRKAFDYRLPPDWTGAIPKPGCRITVPFGRSTRVGVLIKVHDHQPEYSLKAINQVLDSEPVLPGNLLQLLLWASDYYCHPVGEVISTALPRMLRQGKPATPPVDHRWQVTSGSGDHIQALSRAPKQQAILKYLLSSAAGRSEEELNRQFVGWRQPMKALAVKQFVSRVQHQIHTDMAYLDADYALSRPQQEAVRTVLDQLLSFSSYLLFGVTGSGKTEVYLQLARAIIEQGRQVLILVPEIGLTPQLNSRFHARFGVGIVSLHSGLSDSERHSAWLQARSGQARIVIGTRSAVFTPLLSPGLIIVDEEHDASYKQMDGFRYSARDIAIKRASSLDIPVLLGSATPSIETFQNVKNGRCTQITLPNRVGRSGHPDFTLLNLSGQKLQGGLSRHALDRIRHELEHEGQALIFLNRRGYAPMLRCTQCGWVAECHHCDIRLTLHRRDNRLRCHVCAHEQPVPTACPECGNHVLQTVGQGTEQLEEVMTQTFPDTRVIRIDRDSTRARGAFQGIIDQVADGKQQILVGTQMLAKGHHFPNVATVIILDADNGLYGLDFRAQEHMAQLIVQVAGRAGRGHRAGHVYIQTWHPDHPFFASLQSLAYDQFVGRLMDERRQTAMPPYSHLALLRVESSRMHNSETFSHEAEKLARQLNSDRVELLGPAVAPLERKAGLYRMQLLIRATDRAGLHAFLRPWLVRLDELKSGKSVRWSIDIDPYSLY